jgi:peptide/nickel transport system substrate-binding protein
VVFRHDLTPAEALELCISTDGEVDIVTEVSPATAERVKASTYARLVAADANRVLVGIINRSAAGTPLDDRRVRKALNLAVDTQKIIDQGFLGYARPLCALTPSWCSGFTAGAQPYRHDPEQARALIQEAGWPKGRHLRLATPGALARVARLMASDLEPALGITVDILVVPDNQLFAGLRRLVEKRLPLEWDVLIHGWFDLSSEAPPAAVHREFFGADGAFRAGPVLPEFDRLYSEMATQLDPTKLVEAAERIDCYAFDEALAIFLCAPQALYAVNRHVNFGPYRTTFELAEAEVEEGHWSSGRVSVSGAEAASPSQEKTTDFAGSSSGNAC